jgi:hypothetical protein
MVRPQAFVWLDPGALAGALLSSQLSECLPEVTAPTRKCLVASRCAATRGMGLLAHEHGPAAVATHRGASDFVPLSPTTSDKMAPLLARRSKGIGGEVGRARRSMGRQGRSRGGP